MDMSKHLGANKFPLRGSSWRHHSGETYVVLMMTNVEPGRQEDFPTTVVYQNLRSGKRYSRPLRDWLPKMTPIP